MIYGILLGVDVLLAIALIALILLQRGQGAEVGASFGGGGASASMFGARGAAPFVTRLIAVLAALFLINSLALTYIANRDFGEDSVLDAVEGEAAAGGAGAAAATAVETQEASADDAARDIPE